MSATTANLGGTYPSAASTIGTVAGAREAASAFLNCSPEEVGIHDNLISNSISLLI